MTEQLETQRMIQCPRCRSENVIFKPRPGQLTTEDNLGPFDKVHDFLKDARLSEPDGAGITYILSKQTAGSPTHWPAELNCPRCTEEDRIAAGAWANQMGYDD